MSVSSDTAHRFPFYNAKNFQTDHSVPKLITSTTAQLKSPNKMDCSNKKMRADIELGRCLEGRGDEPLLKQYSCAWHKDGSILVHGHIYITYNHICFYSNILWETKLAISFTEVTNIAKQKTALVVPNAITISTLEREYFLTSFLHRNNAFRVLQLVWKYSMRGIRLTKDQLSQLIEVRKQQEEQLATATPTSSSSGVRVNRTSDEETTTTNRICVVHETTTTSTSSDSTPSDAGNELCSDYVSQRTDSTLTEGRGSDSMSDDNNNPQHQSDSLASLDSVDGLNISNKEEPQPFKEENSDRSRTRWSWIEKKRAEMSPAVIINMIIMILIMVLLVSMLTIICKLCELDPHLKPWLFWQPWCRLVCHRSSYTPSSSFL